MDLMTAKKMANMAMERHGLLAKGWSFRFDNARVRFGVCSHGRKVVGLSRRLVPLNNESQVLDTILHEIAHALVGPGHGHDSKWKLMCVQVGAKPERCYTAEDVTAPKGRFQATCADCGITIQRYKHPSPGIIRSGYHPKCKYKANGGKLMWTTSTGHPLVPPPRFSYPLPHPVQAPMLQQAASQPAPQIQTPALTQSDIGAMWERLNRLEGK